MTQAPLKLANVPGSIEMDRETFRKCVDVVKATRGTTVASLSEPGEDPAFLHYVEGNDKPFAVAIYPQGPKSARYFILMNKIPSGLKAQIQKLEKIYAKDKLSDFLRSSTKHQAEPVKKVHPKRSHITGVVIGPKSEVKPFHAKRRS